MWTVTLLDKKTAVDGSVKLVVAYTKGPRTVTKEYTFFGDFDLNAVVNNEIAGFDKLISTFTGLSVGQLTVIPSVAAAAPTAQQQFFTTVGKLQTYQNLINLGVIDNTNTSYQAIKSSVTSGFNASFI